MVQWAEGDGGDVQDASSSNRARFLPSSASSSSERLFWPPGAANALAELSPGMKLLCVHNHVSVSQEAPIRLVRMEGSARDHGLVVCVREAHVRERVDGPGALEDVLDLVVPSERAGDLGHLLDRLHVHQVFLSPGGAVGVVDPRHTI